MQRRHYRFVNNHDAMVESLRAWFPCETIKTFPAQTSLRDTVYLYSGAKVVLGPHGAGFGNLIFTQPPSPEKPLSVIELLFPTRIHIFSRIARLLGAK